MEIVMIGWRASVGGDDSGKGDKETDGDMSKRKTVK